MILVIIMMKHTHTNNNKKWFHHIYNILDYVYAVRQYKLLSTTNY